MADQEVQFTYTKVISIVLLVIFILVILVSSTLIIIFVNNYKFLNIFNWILLITVILLLITNTILNTIRFANNYSYIDIINWVLFGIMILLVIFSVVLVTIKGVEINKIIFITIGILILLFSLLLTVLPYFFSKDKCGKPLIKNATVVSSVAPKALQKKEVKEIYSYNSSTKSLDPITIPNIGTERVVDITQSGSSTYYILSNGNIFIKTKNDKGDSVSGIINQSIKIDKFRDNNLNNHYALNNNTLYYSEDLVNWTPLFYNVDDFDIPYDGRYMYVKFNDKSIIYDTVSKKIDKTLNTSENRVYGRNINEYIVIKDNKIVKSDGVSIPNALKAVYDTNGELHVLYPNQKLMDKYLNNIYGTQTSIIYGI